MQAPICTLHLWFTLRDDKTFLEVAASSAVSHSPQERESVPTWSVFNTVVLALEVRVMGYRA